MQIEASHECLGAWIVCNGSGKIQVVSKNAGHLAQRYGKVFWCVAGSICNFEEP